MRKLLFSALALSGLFFASCNSDKCKSKVCGNGECNILTGACDCKSGYEADANGACNVLSREKFLTTSGIASYSVVEKCGTSTSAPYSVLMKQGNSTDSIKIETFGNYDIQVNATTKVKAFAAAKVTKSNFAFTNYVSGPYKFTGTGGLVSERVVTVTYSANYNTTTTDNCSCTLTR